MSLSLLYTLDISRETSPAYLCHRLGDYRQTHYAIDMIIYGLTQPMMQGLFSFLYLKKIKISKIYVRFEKFQKYPAIALWGGDRGPVAQATGDRTLM